MSRRRVARNMMFGGLGVAATAALSTDDVLAQSDLGQPVPLVDALDVPPLMTPNGRLFQVDGAGLSTVRTASQVLAVAYGSATPGTRGGAFFPDGVNGVIAAV